ncbi:gamma-glutamyl-gamma-aminobutyrate hydrolase family protein [Lacticaseibacillus daqingensis]|uniref:gamma-glutamyl-gamma-aminobutyrate hydrolase family protein n=1 Tax=Lacticaseibacillus daqingensis TaxID=2486014 RepID=UPI000F7B8BDF|nr:gamma-glutamyl-gamma-aminobutyrate hydrolase family protein [Lacticaseibacillus daqingensis]
MRPTIAIVADTMSEPSDVINYNNADIIPNMIKNALIQTGGTPIVLPFPEQYGLVNTLVDQYIRLFDGLMLPGGPDIDPQFYGEDPTPQMGHVVYPEDVFELALIRATVKAGKPIFAICRGMQILNVALGGNLYQDLESNFPTATIRHAQAPNGQYPHHPVRVRDGSHLHAVIGKRAIVNSRHHQAVRQLGHGLQVSATAPDGVVEAIESTHGDQCLGVQWHPENLYLDDHIQLRLFADLIRRAQGRRI